MQIQILHPQELSYLDEKILANQIYSIFYTSYWANVLSESYRYKPLFFTITESNTLLAFIPCMEVKSLFTGKRGISLPFTDFCEPIITETKYFNIIIDYILSYGKNAQWKYFEIRGGNEHKVERDASATYYLHDIDLNGDESKIFSNLKSNIKRNIRKALREGVKVEIHHSLDAIKQFYRLNCITRKKHGIPPQPYNFFRNVFKYIISENKGFVVLATYNEIIIAGAIYFFLEKKAIYKYGASDDKYQHLRANNLVMWSAIKWFIENGYQSLSLGRTAPTNVGLIRFKEGWGTTKRELKYYTYNIKINHQRQAVPRKINNMISICLKKMPIFILKIIGRIVYRHIG